MEDMICFGYLAGISVYDVFFRKISTAVLLSGTVLAVGYSLILSENTWLVSALGAAVGGVLLVAAYVTDQAVGYGDGWLLTALGIFLGIWGLFEVLIAAWISMAVAAGVCLVKKKWSRHASLPMSPFLMLGYVIFIAGEVIYG